MDLDQEDFKNIDMEKTIEEMQRELRGLRNQMERLEKENDKLKQQKANQEEIPSESNRRQFQI